MYSWSHFWTETVDIISRKQTFCHLCLAIWRNTHSGKHLTTSTWSQMRYCGEGRRHAVTVYHLRRDLGSAFWRNTSKIRSQMLNFQLPRICILTTRRRPKKHFTIGGSLRNFSLTKVTWHLTIGCPSGVVNKLTHLLEHWAIITMPKLAKLRITNQLNFISQMNECLLFPLHFFYKTKHSLFTFQDYRESRFSQTISIFSLTLWADINWSTRAGSCIIIFGPPHISERGSSLPNPFLFFFS